MLDDSEKARVFLKYIGRHFGCLAVTYFALDARGGRVGEPMMRAYSGFFLLLDERWFFVTAGHVFENSEEPEKGLEYLLRKNRIEIVRTSLIDYLGIGAKIHQPTILVYEDVPKFYVDDRSLGLDFALLPLRDFYVEGVKSNGICPIMEKNWLLEGNAEALGYGVLGLPEESQIMNQPTEHVAGWLRPVFARVDKCDRPSDAPAPNYPLFVARLRGDNPRSIVGMSGGPIYGLKREADGSIGYWVAAIQASWKRSERIVYGCPVSVAVAVFRHVIAKLHPSAARN